MPNSRSSIRRFSVLLLLVLALGRVGDLSVQATSSTIVISQVYGGGGNAGATLKNDFIELFNRGTTNVSLSGWSVQYASAAGTTWLVTSLTNVSLAPGQYYLVQEAPGTGGTTSLPTADSIGNIAMSSTNAKVALVNSTVALSGGCPTGPTVVDFIGFGTGASQPSCFEGAPAPTLSNTTADSRKTSGCAETDNNGADFAAGTPAPRNTSSALAPCGGPTNPSASGGASPSTVSAGASTLLTVTVIPGTNPTSTGIGVTANLLSIGGSPAQQFYDDGTHGDTTPNNNIFSFQATVDAATAPGAKTIAAGVVDAQSRTAQAAITLTVQSPTNPTGSGAAAPSNPHPGDPTLLTVTVTPGQNPTSTGIAVTGNLSSIGGSATQAFFDNGTNGDVTAGDNIFSLRAVVPAAADPGLKTIPATIADAQGRSSRASISLTVTAASTPPAGVGSASPGSLQGGSATLLTVNVTPGSNPASTGLGVAGDLTSIGGLASQQFYDDGSHGDVIPNDGVFSFQAIVANNTPGSRSLPVTIADAQARSSTITISLIVQPPTTVKISQVYGGGGNSGTTFTNDFIEIFNEGPDAVDVTFWSVQHTSGSGTTWTPTNLCLPSHTCNLLPGRYYLVQESQGAGGTTSLPAPDAIGSITMGAGSGKVALVADTAPLIGACPAGGVVVDLVGYGSSANCSETAPTASLSNATAAVRRGNGCVDTDNNANDFVAIGPIPRNSAAPPNSCGGDPTQPSGLGIAFPSSVDPASNTLLTVRITPASTPPSTDVSVAADLTSIGGALSQPFYDDGTHGDVTGGDNVFSFQATAGAFIQTGVKSIVATLADAEGRRATAPVTLTILSPTCGVERWSVKTGTDPDAGLVNLDSPIRTTILDLVAFPAPPDPPGPPLNARIAPAETAVYVLNATMTLYKKEGDVDYHIVLEDGAGHTLIAEIPSPACVGASSPFAAAVAGTRSKFDARLTATSFFQTANVPVQVKGVAFFDFIHGQTGVAPDGIELHPVLEINFTANTNTTLMVTANPSQFGQPDIITATVSNGGHSTPTGHVTFVEGGSAPLSIGALDQNGRATFTTSTLSAGSHSITAYYEGDSTSAPSTSAPLAQVVNKADQTIEFGALAGQVYGHPDFPVSATASSGLAVSFSISSGPATISGNMIHITGAGTVTVRASQAGDSNYNPATDVDQSFDVAKANQSIVFAALPDRVYGAAPFAVGATGGGSGNAVTFSAAGACTSNGAAIAITSAGSCTVTASQAGNDNYDAATSVPRDFTINRAAGAFVVGGYSGVYDGHPHGATGSATGVNGEDLRGLLALGAVFTDVPGGTAHWTFAGNTNYEPASGDATITIVRATAAIAVTGYTGVYDGRAHGAGGSATGVNNDDLMSLLNLGATFTDVPGGTAHWAFAGDANYEPASGDATVTITRAAAAIGVGGYTGVYDAQAHGATGSAAGLKNEDLTSLLNLGARFTDVPGGTALWSFAGNTNYATASGAAGISITQATPSFSNLSAPTITDHTSSTILSGTIGLGSLIPTGSVAVTVNGVTQNAAVQPGGGFSSSVATGSLSPSMSPYTITYRYSGDGNFASTTGSGSLTVQDTTPPAFSGVPLDQMTEATGPGGAAVTYALPIATDLVDGNRPVSCSPGAGATFPLGTTTVTCTASDTTGHAATATFKVTVVDTTPPAMAPLSATPSVLWPPNGKLVPVRIAVSATDAADPAPSCAITGIVRTDTDEGRGPEGNDRPNFVITGPLTASLRAEGGAAHHIVYTLTVECADRAGNRTAGAVAVGVAKSR